jgi:sterol desaturase/sphingolipid hydroxylase (fatty acid hydroxylase superfamily)
MWYFLIYDAVFLLIYFSVSSFICFQEGYNLSNKLLQNEMIKGTKHFIIQLALSNITITCVLPYTYMGDYWSIINCIAYLLYFDTFVFWSHICLHRNKYLFHTIHQKHHKTLYVSPFSTTILSLKEYLLNTVLPTTLPLFFIRMNFASWTIVNLLIFFHGIFIHSTYKLPYEGYFLLGSKSHSIHHVAKSTNFGFLFPWWDKILGTNNTNISRERITKQIKNNYK